MSDDLDAMFEALRAKRKNDEPKSKATKAAAKTQPNRTRSAIDEAGVPHRGRVAAPAPAKADRSRPVGSQAKPAEPAPDRPAPPAPAPAQSFTGLRKASSAEKKALKTKPMQFEDQFGNPHPPKPAAAHEAADRLFGQYTEDGYKGVRPPPFVRDPVAPRMVPKRHTPGSLKVGDSVWYCNQRYWITQAPNDWSDTCYIQISTIAARPGMPIPDGAHVQSVHADALELAPVKGPSFGTQPTKHAIETEKKKKELGITHVGDDIGAMLQGKTLDEVYKIASKYLGVPERELRSKYEKLNPGQQRMNCGNRMRALAKKKAA